MKIIFLMASMMMAFTTITLSSNINHFNINVGASEELIPEQGTIKVAGKNLGTSVTTTINSDGSSTSEINISCGGSPDFTCYTVEFSAAGLTEVSPNGGESVQGLLIDSDQDNHWYKLKVNQ